MKNIIGVCCEYDHKNYGSMLQTFATLEKLNRMGYDYEIINYSKKLTLDLLLKSLDRIPEEIKDRIRRYKKKHSIQKHPDIYKSAMVRNECFNRFRDKYFYKTSQVSNSFAELHENAKSYSAVLLGSDQLWVPKGYSTGFYNLLFVPDDIRKVAYATSFGVSNIPANKIKIAQKFLNRMEYISVRELRASEMIKELTGREVPTVVDPTILFTGEQWKELLPVKPVVNNEKYIFCYFLGNNPEQREEVLKLSKETGLKIVFLPHLDEFIESDLSFGDLQLYDIGPTEFVNLIRGAEYVCTDSFHGSVFSILNHKKFITFNRFRTTDPNSRNSRIDSLLGQTGLENRRYSKDLVSQITADIDYDSVEQKLATMRKLSEDYLAEALNNLPR